MKHSLKALMLAAIFAATGTVQADPIKDSTLGDYKAGWYPNTYKEQLLTCPQACKAWIRGVAEHEPTGIRGADNNVCKFSYGKKPTMPFQARPFLYGNQLDKTPVCYTADTTGTVRKSKQFYCLCITGSQCSGPDLVVTNIDKPQWDATNQRSVITAEIKNIGSGGAAASIARIIDPSTLQSTGAPQNAIANTPALAAGASATVTFYLPYWVYNPDADLEVTADYKAMIEECDESNNTKTYHDQG